MTLRFRLGPSYREVVSTLHCALENGEDLHVNESQKIRHYRPRSTEERRRIKSRKKNAKSQFFFFRRCARILRYYSAVIDSFDWKSAVGHNGSI